MPKKLSTGALSRGVPGLDIEGENLHSFAIISKRFELDYYKMYIITELSASG